VGVPAGRAVQQELAGHAEMHGQTLAAIQFHDDELASPPDSVDAPSGQRRTHLVGVAAQYAQTKEFGGDDAPADYAGDRARYGFDFR
jgi:hypothetical protein